MSDVAGKILVYDKDWVNRLITRSGQEGDETNGQNPFRRKRNFSKNGES
jgi:hypothetical protein